MSDKDGAVKLKFLIFLVLLLGLGTVCEAGIKENVSELKNVGIGILAPIVNTIFFTLLVYILLRFFGIDLASLGNKAIVFGVAAVLVGLLIFSPVIGAAKGSRISAMKDIEYFWNADYSQGMKYLLFGTHPELPAVDAEGEPMGILRSTTRLGIFLGAFLVFLWLFKILKVGEDVAKLNIVMALLISYSMATSPTTKLNMVIMAGQVVAFWAFYNSLQGTILNKKVAAFGALVLVTVLTQIAFPNISGVWTLGAKGIGGLLLVAACFTVTFLIVHSVAGKIGGGTPP